MRPFWKAFYGGVAGMTLAFSLGLLAYHVYTDHQSLHAIINLINSNLAKQPPK